MAAAYPSLKNLERLSFAGNGLDDDAAVCSTGRWRPRSSANALDELDLSDNLIRAAGSTRLSLVPSLARVRRLVLTGNPLTDLGRRMLRNHFGDRVVF